MCRIFFGLPFTLFCARLLVSCIKLNQFCIDLFHDRGGEAKYYGVIGTLGHWMDVLPGYRLVKPDKGKRTAGEREMCKRPTTSKESQLKFLQLLRRKK